MRDLSRIYDAQFYESYNAEQEADIRAAADTLFDVFRPKYAADMGCGPGMMVRRLRELMVNAIGFDGSAHALKKAHETMIPFLHVMDITGNPLIWNQDLVICTEVAEHVPEHLADRLVDNLCCARDQDGHIVLTAAPPGQGGHDHINEKPMSYWIEKFALRGILVNDEKTAAVRAGWSDLKRMWFYPANVRVFGR